MEAPSPKPYPVVGHLPYLTVKGKAQPEILHDLVQDFDYDCVKLNIAGKTILLTANPDHVQQMVEDAGSFGKIVHDMTRGPFWAARQSAGKGLFTTSDMEEEWGIAHRVLISAFSMQGMKEAVPLAVEATLDAARVFENLGTSANVEIGGSMTGITFDVIGRFSCGLDFGTSKDPDIRYSHPFLLNMDTTLTTNTILGDAPYKARLPSSMMRSRKEAIRRQHEYVRKIIDDRRSGRQVAARPDLLSRMLEQTDPETGRKMEDDIMAANLITFFAAGHDSTSSLLTTAMFYISQYPEVEERLVAEINEVLPGEDDVPTYQDLKKFKYMTQVLKECLRLHPPAPGFLKRALKDGKIGSYNLMAGTQVLTSLAALHTNPAIWGPNAAKFDPEHFSPEAEAARHKYSWLPFSAGARACIGMQLSLTEARVALAILWKKFTFRLHKSARVYGDYSKVFFKLRDVQMTAHPRAAATCVVPRAPAAAILQEAESPITPKPQQPSGSSSNSNGQGVPPHGTSVNVYYGSNMGNCKGIAEQSAAAAKVYGFHPVLAPLDQAIGELPALAAAKGLALIVTSTYNGTPPDNARKFSKWAETSSDLSGLQVGVLGIGNSNWKTFQAFPRKVMADLKAASATSLLNHGEVDEEDDLESAVEQWSASFWTLALAAAGQKAPAANVTMTTASQGFTVTVTNCPSGATAMTHPANTSARTGTVLRTYDLASSDAAKRTRHVEIQLPKGVTYSHGDHLAVMPINSFDTVLRVAICLGVELDDIVMLGSAGGEELAHLPYNVPVNIRRLLLHHVDLSAALSHTFLTMAAEKARKPAEQAAILALADKNSDGADDMRLVQLLESFSSLKISLPDVLPLLPPMRQRYYSISSSPAGPCGPRVASITVGLVEGHSQIDNSHYQGLASGLLHNLMPGMPVDVFVASNDRFRLPVDPKAPVMMIGPGTGLAPFRGFLQELAANPREAPAALFFGCRSEAEYIYKTELEAAAMAGTLEHMSVAFSRAGPEKVYVQHKLWESRSAVWEMLKNGGYVYVCGDARHMAKDVDQTLVRIVQEVGAHSYESALEFVQGLTESDRYLQDVWAN